ncbi:MAG: hypothetical protein HZA31_12130 [Opitutae bacterium]|nr:hypothetical protein [Opitutae bacterium]
MSKTLTQPLRGALVAFAVSLAFPLSTLATDPYPRSQTPALDLAQFREPAAEYRGAPFWSWNTAMQARHLAQMDELKAMGFGGATIHARTGLATEYLGPDFMRLVQDSTARAQKLGMYVLLYDEDRWPSGFAGGLVTKDEQYRQRRLLWTPKTETQPGRLLGRFAVKLDDAGCLASYQRLAEGAAAPTDATVWSAYVQVATPSERFNNQTYVDTLNPAAIRRFAESTFDRYHQAVGAQYGRLIPGMFTDEPQFVRKGSLAQARAKADVLLPFTDDFLASYEKAFGQKLDELLPELYWELPAGRVSTARWRYHEHVATRFTEAFAATLGAWCEKQGVALTGHMMKEQPISGQSGYVGDAMRSLQYFQIPGIDMLCDYVEYLTAKQAQSAAHQAGRNAVLSELYGVTGWHFDFGGHKRQGDWQAALGVTLRVPHLAWVSMAGEAKRDYPAAIGWQSPWYKEYPLVEDHFARVNTALTRGQPRVRVAVVHPIESVWLAEGPREQTEPERKRQDEAAENFAAWLIHGQIDYFLCEASLPRLHRPAGKGFAVGAMTYDVVAVPQLRTIRASTLERLEAFAAAGGQVIFAGEAPALVDAQPSDRAQKLAARCQQTPWASAPVLAALAPWRDVEVIGPAGQRATRVVHQLRQDGARRWLFLCQNDRQQDLGRARVTVAGDWSVTRFDTLTGQTERLATTSEGARTVVDVELFAQGSMLLALDPGAKPGGAKPGLVAWTEGVILDGAVPVTLSEPNALLLDQAEWRWQDEPWQPREEILRLDVMLRKKLGLPLRGGNMAQPWTNTTPAELLGTVSLKLQVRCEVPVTGAKLALEEAATARITVDGQPVTATPQGWWVDECYPLVAMPPLAAGTHEIVIAFPFTRKTNLEWCYLLGDFGVRVQGRDTAVIAPVRTLRPGSWVEQGLPFYAGNVTYHFAIEGGERAQRLNAAGFQAPLLAVTLDGRPAGKIAFAPYCLELGKLAPGRHALDVMAFGNRANAFGIVHHTNMDLPWYGPNAWRSTGKDWTYEYNLRPTGLLKAPRLQAIAPAVAAR